MKFLLLHGILLLWMKSSTCRVTPSACMEWTQASTQSNSNPGLKASSIRTFSTERPGRNASTSPVNLQLSVDQRTCHHVDELDLQNMLAMKLPVI
ncbi:hypothetical protein V8C26DRAFT_291999 [Trichoderma gracile]